MEHDIHCVAGFLTYKIQISGKTSDYIARQINYDFHRINERMKQGEYDLPLQKIGPLAASLGANPAFLLRMVLEEYYPETFAALKPLLQGLELTEDELGVVEAYREFTKGLEVEKLVGVIMKEKE